MSGYIGTQPVPQATQTRDSFTATSGQTSFATGGYTPNFLDVYLNGVKLASADYTATNGSDVVLASGAATGDILEVVAFTTFNSASSSIDDNGNATAITIDSSENVMVGTTVTPVNLLTGTSGGGMAFDPTDNYLVVAREGTNSVKPALRLNQTGVDGDIAEFRKDGSTVGTIGVDSSTRLYFTNNTGAGLFLSDGSQVEPMSNGTRTDDTMSLGGSVYRFRNAYLSGGVYLGGTGSANKLDDYEEGTGTLTVTGTGGGTATTSGGANYQYTKVGNLVSFQFEFNCTSVSGVSGTLQIALPFVSQDYVAGSLRCYSATFDGSPFLGITENTSQVYFNTSKTGTATQNILSTGYYFGQITYRTT